MRHNKLFCSFGWHVYKPSNADVKHIQGIIYRITMKCECCGKLECGLIRVPLPMWQEQEVEDDKDAAE